MSKFKDGVRTALQKTIDMIMQNPRVEATMLDKSYLHMISIGDGFVSSIGSRIIAHDASYIIHTGKYGVAPVNIGKRVFLGANALVLSGVTIGDDVVVGAGSVVATDIPSGVVVGGVPAKIICTIDEYVKKAEERGTLHDPRELHKDNPKALANLERLGYLRKEKSESDD